MKLNFNSKHENAIEGLEYRVKNFFPLTRTKRT